PIQSTVAAEMETREQNEQQGKDWEKLPKQDEKAAGLLSDSLLPADLDWVDAALITRYNQMGSPGATETAQVQPFLFTNAMADLAKEKGVEIKTSAKVTKINHSKTGVRNVEYEDRATGNTCFIDDVTDVVVCAGPWTGRVLPRTKVEGLRAHSVVFDV